ncbi:MAG: hypothetical protein HYY84_01225 [Deltaproteobacteria bacterium]|nr:hypothetical protein [Deltaproteobacteria bacterium]
MLYGMIFFAATSTFSADEVLLEAELEDRRAAAWRDFATLEAQAKYRQAMGPCARDDREIDDSIRDCAKLLDECIDGIERVVKKEPKHPVKLAPGNVISAEELLRRCRADREKVRRLKDLVGVKFFSDGDSTCFDSNNCVTRDWHKVEEDDTTMSRVVVTFRTRLLTQRERDYAFRAVKAPFAFRQTKPSEEGGKVGAEPIKILARIVHFTGQRTKTYVSDVTYVGPVCKAQYIALTADGILILVDGSELTLSPPAPARWRAMPMRAERPWGSIGELQHKAFRVLPRDTVEETLFSETFLSLEEFEKGCIKVAHAKAVEKIREAGFMPDAVFNDLFKEKPQTRETVEASSPLFTIKKAFDGAAAKCVDERNARYEKFILPWQRLFTKRYRENIAWAGKEQFQPRLKETIGAEDLPAFCK